MPLFTLYIFALWLITKRVDAPHFLTLKFTTMTQSTVIVITPDQLQQYIGQAVEAIIPKLADFRRRNEAKKTDNLTMVEAIDYLAELGAPTTRSSIYNLVFRGQIPHRKIGRRTIFSRKELQAWVESRTVRPDDAKKEAIRRIADSANRKLAR